MGCYCWEFISIVMTSFDNVWKFNWLQFKIESVNHTIHKSCVLQYRPTTQHMPLQELQIKTDGANKLCVWPGQKEVKSLTCKQIWC